jgi:hypothetical protein
MESVLDNASPPKVFSDPEEASNTPRPASATRLRADSPRPGLSEPSCVSAIRRHLASRGFSSKAVERIIRERRASTLKMYSAKWTILEKWCKSRKLNPLSLCTADLADFFIYLFNVRKLAPITIKGYRSAIARVYRLCGLRNPSQDPHLSNLVNNFSLERPRNIQLFSKWSIDVVLMYISKTPFEPLDSATLENLTLKTVFLVTLALAGRVSEIHALSARKDCRRFNQDESVSLLSFPGFLAKNALPERGNQQYVLRPLPESLLCPVRALKVYLKRTERQ